ncbi:glycosyltransferase family 2 protein [Thermoleptolyngbya sichuanensis A183]|uniref:Glycosyltransferase family 2 protein n=1 Tax=Thermoleptolyngbya sichuanensis A183 TaxID=2737172 RepID=A0A6M8BHD2_9CYAN|nr:MULTISPECIES: glycosyltransferase family 2 protein [Thermoleptolyngbya]QKD83051.1 glycosyltransferase family 2 protein [Thermoleptolyngbya sichuanensis A183]
MKKAVAIIIFNRPDKTLKVLDKIRQAKPEKLFVIADGPRSENINDAKRCSQTRAIIDQVDWECEILKNYSEHNLGCGKRVASGLDWVFSLVDEAIILEDDCVPHSSFFSFCEELLDRYRDDARVMSICGKNVQFGRNSTKFSYYFSRYAHCWGWATWSRAWKYFDYDMLNWEMVKSENLLEDILGDSRSVGYWTSIFQSVYERRYQSASWAYRWLLSSWLQNGLSILPGVNLVSNIGFGEDATHTTTTSERSQYANMQTETMQFPLKHPPYLIRNRAADKFEQDTLFDPSLMTRARAKLLRMLGKKVI